jgi:dihydropteroate synthase type 2
MTAILGIVNLTPDSYSDGGQFLNPDLAIPQAQALYEAGAAAIDLGPSSSHPGAPTIPPALEIKRLEPVLDALLTMQIPISVDSFHPETQRYALSRGVDFLNDVHGFAYPDFYPELADAECRLIVMHSVHGAQPAQRIVTDPAVIMSQIIEFFHQRVSALTRSGIARERLILDPGMGFFLSAEPEASLVVLQQLIYQC